MRELNEYKTRLNELKDKLLRVLVKTYEVEYTDTYVIGRKRTVKYNMCMINGIKYVQASDVAYPIMTRKETILKNGYLKESDFVYLCSFARNNQPRAFISVETLLKQDLKILLGNDNFYYLQAMNVIEHAQIALVENIIVPTEYFVQSQQVYHEIQKVRKEKRAYDLKLHKEREEQLERESDAQRIEDGKKEERTLRDLVGQIEEMGWHVTLSLK